MSSLPISYPNFLYTFISLNYFNPWLFSCKIAFVLNLCSFTCSILGFFSLSLLPISSLNFLHTFITLINFTPWFFLIMQDCTCFDSLLFYLFCFKCSTSYILRVYFDSLYLRKTLLDAWILSVCPWTSSFSSIYQAIFTIYFCLTFWRNISSGAQWCKDSCRWFLISWG